MHIHSVWSERSVTKFAFVVQVDTPFVSWHKRVVFMTLPTLTCIQTRVFVAHCVTFQNPPRAASGCRSCKMQTAKSTALLVNGFSLHLATATQNQTQMQTQMQIQMQMPAAMSRWAM